MPTQPRPAGPLAQARALIDQSGLTACRAERDRLEQHDRDLLRELQALTRQEAQARRTAAGDLDLDALLEREETGESIRDALTRVQRERVENARQVRQARERYAVVLAEVDKQVRGLMTTARQARVAAITLAAMQLGDLLADDRRANMQAETLMAEAGLRDPNFESLLPGIFGRLCVTDGTLPPFDDIAKEWTARGWLVGATADRAAARALANRQALDRAGMERHRREEEGQKQAALQVLQTRRRMLASGDLTYDRPGGGFLSPEEATSKFDRLHSGLPQPKPAPTTAGGLASVG